MLSIYTGTLLKFWIDALRWETESTYTDLVTDSAIVSLSISKLYWNELKAEIYTLITQLTKEYVLFTQDLM